MLKRATRGLCGLTGHTFTYEYWENLDGFPNENIREQFPNVDELVADTDGYRSCDTCGLEQFISEDGGEMVVDGGTYFVEGR